MSCKNSSKSTNKNQLILYYLISMGNYQACQNCLQPYNSKQDGTIIKSLPSKILQSPIHRSIVAILGINKHSNSTVFGNGVLLSKNIILTSASLLHDNENGDNNKSSFKIFAGGDFKQHYQIEDWRCQNQSIEINGKKIQVGCALVKIKKTPLLPSQYDSFLELSTACQCVLNKKQQIEFSSFFNLQQNQSDSQKQEKSNSNINLYGLRRNNCIEQILSDHSIMKHTIPIYTGQVGCPIFVNDKIVAIQIAQSYGFAKLITTELIDKLQAWRKSLKGDLFRVYHSKQCSHSFETAINLQEIDFDDKQLLKDAQKLQKTAQKYKNHHNYLEALQHYQQSLLIKENILGKRSIQAAEALHKIGWVYYNQNNYNKSVQYYTTALQIFQETKGKGCHESANTLNNLGLSYNSQGKYSQALNNYIMALSIYQNEQQESNHIEKANIYNNIAMIYNNQEKYIEAINYCVKALSTFQELKGKGCYQSAATLNNMGYFYNNQEKYEEALNAFTLALEIKQKIKGKGCLESANTLKNMGIVYKNLKNYEKAMNFCTLALQIEDKIKGTDCFQSAYSHNNIGLVYASQENYSKALQYYQKSITIFNKFQIRNIEYGQVLENKGDALVKITSHEQAMRAFQSSLQIYKGTPAKGRIKRIIKKLEIGYILVKKTKQHAQLLNQFKQQFDQM